MSEPRMLRWETLSKSGFGRIDREQAVVLLTCSPLEVHGPHLPLGADVLELGPGEAERKALPRRSHARLPRRATPTAASSRPRSSWRSTATGSTPTTRVCRGGRRSSGSPSRAVGELLDGSIGPEDCHSPIWKYRFLFLNPLMIRLSNWALGLRIPIA